MADIVINSGYRLMWMMVMFDLPTNTAKERKAAAGFRKFLLDLGFEMSQYSVYFRFCGTREKTEPYVKKIKSKAPQDGKISILFFTDKQFADIIHVYGGIETSPEEKPANLTIF
jgi:CRISPR-associated protein Cas2